MRSDRLRGHRKRRPAYGLAGTLSLLLAALLALVVGWLLLQ